MLLQLLLDTLGTYPDNKLESKDSFCNLSVIYDSKNNFHQLHLFIVSRQLIFLKNFYIHPNAGSEKVSYRRWHIANTLQDRDLKDIKRI